MIRVAIAEDNRAYSKALVDTLHSLDGVELTIVSKNGRDIYHEIVKATEKPQVVLMDIEMPVTDGISATARIKKTFPEIKVVMISVFDDRERVFEAILAGASGYLLKGERPDIIHNAIKDAIENRLPMSPAIAGLALELIKSSKPVSVANQENNLTVRENEILKEVARAKPYKQIAEELSISVKTVSNHVQNIYAKLQVSSKAEAVRMAYENQWV